MRAYSIDLRERVLMDCDAGMGNEAVARKYHVSSRWVYKIRRQRAETGDITPRRGKTGPKPKLFDDAKLKRLEDLLSQGATTHGWVNDLWTIQRVREVIKIQLGVELSSTTVWKVLKSYLGWTSQKPTTKLRERDEEKVEHWRLKEFARIESETKKRGAYLGFADEAGFMLTPTLRKTFAPRASRPFTKISDPHGRISPACAITLSPNRRRPNLFFYLHRDNANFTGESIAGFLKYLCRELHSPLTLIWDSIPIHFAQPVRDFLSRNKQIVLEMLPEYAP